MSIFCRFFYAFFASSTLYDNIIDIWTFCQSTIILSRYVYCNQNTKSNLNIQFIDIFFFTEIYSFHIWTSFYAWSSIDFSLFFIEYTNWIHNRTIFMCLNYYYYYIHITFNKEEEEKGENDGKKAGHWFFIYLWVICGLGQSGCYLLFLFVKNDA